MIDEPSEDPHFTNFSTALQITSKGKTQRDITIEPWDMDSKLAYKTQVLIKNQKVQTWQNRKTERKKSVDERIVEMYRKYSNQGPLIDNGKPNPANSRQVYREKLKQFENGSEFKRMGSKRETEPQQIYYFSQTKQSEELTFRKANLYCCDYQNCKLAAGGDKKTKSEYKCNDKFQRMLKLKDKIRRKNNLTVSKQKEKYQSEYQPQVLCGQKQPNYAVMAKATIERNKLKLRMRGVSREDMRRKAQFNPESFSIQSRNIQFKTTKDGLSLIYDKWKCLQKEGVQEKMSHTLPYCNR